MEFNGKKDYVNRTIPISIFGTFIPARTIINNTKNIISTIDWPELSSIDSNLMSDSEAENLAFDCIVRICKQENILNDRFSIVQSSTLSDEFSFMNSLLIGTEYGTWDYNETKELAKNKIIGFIDKLGIAKELFEELEDGETQQDAILCEHVSDCAIVKEKRIDDYDLDDEDFAYNLGVKDGANAQYYKVLTCLYKMDTKNKLNHDFDDLEDELKNYMSGMDSKDFEKWLTKYNTYKRGKENE
jgi:hypothetical protein